MSKGTYVRQSYCLWCGKDLREERGVIERLFSSDALCEKCRGQLVLKRRKRFDFEHPVELLYVYEGEGRKMLLQYKELMDEALAPIFLYGHEEEIFRMYRNYVLVPMPSSKEAYHRRGFHHVIQMVERINLPLWDGLEKRQDIEMKHLGKKERYKASRQIQLKKGVEIPKKGLLIVDDVLTTGYSMAQAMNCLKGHKYPIRGLSFFGVEKG